MTEIIALFTVFIPHLSPPTLRQFCRVVFALLARRVSASIECVNAIVSVVRFVLNRLLQRVFCGEFIFLQFQRTCHSRIDSWFEQGFISSTSKPSKSVTFRVAITVS